MNSKPAVVFFQGLFIAGVLSAFATNAQAGNPGHGFAGGGHNSGGGRGSVGSHGSIESRGNGGRFGNGNAFNGSGVFGFGGGVGYGDDGFGYGGGDYYRYLEDRLPYFALHPPVYYSEVVPRTYGYSPFAYPGDLMTPPVEMPVPADVTNPYVAPKKPASTSEQSTTKNQTAAIVPQIMINPFVAQPKAVAVDESPAPDTAQLVYPVAAFRQ